MFVQVKRRSGVVDHFYDSATSQFSAEIVGHCLLVSKNGKPWSIIPFDLVDTVYLGQTNIVKGKGIHRGKSSKG